LVDEIATRVIATGGRVMGVRKADIPRVAALAAILRTLRDLDRSDDAIVYSSPAWRRIKDSNDSWTTWMSKTRISKS
jgi:hypothetical protein